MIAYDSTILMLVLLVGFQFKHLLADYYLQFSYMYENKGKIGGWVRPLSDHAGIHGVLTLAIIIWLVPLELAVTLALFDYVTHFVIDRWKARGTTNIQTSEYWYRLGIDQMLHHIVGIIIVFAVVKNIG